MVISTPAPGVLHQVALKAPSSHGSEAGSTRASGTNLASAAAAGGGGGSGGGSSPILGSTLGAAAAAASTGRNAVSLTAVMAAKGAGLAS